MRSRLTARARPLAALLLVVSLVASGCSLLPGNGSYEVKARFPETYNLFPGSPVRILGVTVGKITDIEVDPGETAVTVTMLVDEGRKIPADAHALVVPEAILGERYVQFVPAYSGGPELDPGDVIPIERTSVPAEFDDVLANLNKFVGALDEDEVGRFASNLATILEGNGEQIGETLESANEAISVLARNDQDLVSLAGRLADLNETLNTRDEQIGQLIEDWNTAAATLVDDRQEIDAALEGLLRLTRTAGDFLSTHRGNLESDIETLTRVGRTLRRNIDNVSLLILSSAELFRHTDRVIDRERNWLPLLNHAEELANELTDTLDRRLVGLCLGAGFSEEECDNLPLKEAIQPGGQLCLPGIIPCETESGPQRVPMAEAIRETVERSPQLQEAIRQRREEREAEGGDPVEDLADELTESATDTLGGSEESSGPGLLGGLTGFDAMLGVL